MNTFSHVPPGFRFHPTEEELVDYYLRKKVASRRIDLDVIKDVDLYKIEPWDIEEKCKIGAEEQNEWYFFSHKDKKYPTGTRTNRATTAGFWKATGRDKPIYSKYNLVGMRKTLVFYKGRAPNGQKSDWIMHEYRLETNENGMPQEEGWVVCRVFKKRVTAIQKASEHDSPCCWYDEQINSFMPDLDYSPKRTTTLQTDDIAPYHHHHLYSSSCKQELELHYHLPHESNFLQLPQLDHQSPSKLLPNYITTHGNALQSSSLTQEEEPIIMPSGHPHQMISIYNSSSSNNTDQAVDQVSTDWRVLDKFVASQLSQDDVSKEPNNFPDAAASIFHIPDKQESVAEYASTSTSSSQIDLWK